MIARKPAVAIAVVGAIIILSGLYYFSSHVSGTTTTTGTSTLSFTVLRATANFNAATGLTNITITIKNTGTVAIKPAPVKTMPPVDGFTYVTGSFHAYFYDANGTRLHPHGGPPNTTGGGKLVFTYLVSGAKVGDTFSVTLDLSQAGYVAKEGVSMTVQSP